MARAKKRKWVELVAGLLVGAAAQPLALLAGPDTSLVPLQLHADRPELVVAQLGGSGSRARLALNGAIDAQRQGDLDRAAALFAEAQARANDLTPDERRELDRLLAANALAMKGRQDALRQMKDAEAALQKGSKAEAASLAKKITANELYLSPADKQRFRALCQRLQVQPAGATGAAAGNAAALANRKLQQARAELTKANLDAAEALAREVDHLRLNFGPREDSPRRVLEDLDRARKDPKIMMLACRAALQRGEMDRAEQYALAADKLATPFTFAFFGDSPAKALKEIQTARLNDKSGSRPAEQAARPAPKPVVPHGDSARARALVKQGRQALTGGDLAGARKCAEQAAALKAELHWSEDNPARLLEDIARAEPHRGGTPTPAGPGIHNKDDALTLLKQGREQLAKGDLDEAYRTASRLQAARHIHWGLFFEDTPDKLEADVKRAREQRDKEKSVELLTEARRLFEKKEYDAAERLAYDARKRHGPYGILDLGDRPDKLLADIQTQREKERRVKLPEAPVTNRETADLQHGPLARQPQQPQQPQQQPANNAVAQGMPPGMNGSTRPPMPPAGPSYGAAAANLAQARVMMKDARTALQRGEIDKARMIANQVRGMKVAFNAPGEETPESIERDAARLMGRPAQERTPPVQLASNTRQTPPPMRSGNTPGDPAQARRLVAEARTLLMQNRLIEAREKLVAAQRLGAPFRPDEDNPSQLYQQTSFLARQRIDSLIHHAGETLRYGTQGPVVRARQAEQDLTQARQLALAFGQDMQPIERTWMMVNQLRGTGNINLAGAQSPGGTLPPADIEQRGGANVKGTPPQQVAAVSPQLRDALQKLEQARTELRNGDTSIARRLAEEAITAGARDQGLAVLRSIDAEERGQQALSANRAFDAVVAAYRRREYRQAGLMLTAIDIKLLNPRNQGRLREMLNTPEMRPADRGSDIALTSAQAPAADKDAPLSPQLNPQPNLHTPENGSGTGRARATDDPDQAMLARTRAMREIKFQQLREQGMKVQSDALERFRSGQTDEALALLQDYLGQLAEQQLDAGQLSLLRRSVESRMQQFKIMKAQVDFANNSNSSMKTFKQNKLRQENAEQVKQRNVADLMKQYNELFRLGKYEDAEALALRVKELDPDNPMAVAAVTMARTQRNRDVYRHNKERKEALLEDGLNDTDDEGDSRAIKSGITFETDPERLKRIQARKSLGELSTLHMPRRTSEEKNIERKLTSPVSMNFINAPLRTVIDDLRATQAINIYVDEPSLAEKGINQDLPVTIKLEQVALKSALNLLLHSVHLTYVIGDDVLKVTTEDQARGKLERRVHQVTDLVLAVENFDGHEKPSEALGIETINQPGTPAPSPITGPQTLTGGQQVGSPTGSMNGSAGGFADLANRGGTTINKTRAQTHEDMLIKLITNTIEPRSWAEQGGPGTIDYHPLTMALIINQTPDIQDQVADLLAALRRLQDQEVAVEVKFISIAEDFFERIGVNFNMNIVNHSRGVPQNEPMLTSGQFAQPGYINQFLPNRFLSGLTPAGTLTSDLNIPISQLTYPQAIPPFGGYPGIPGFGGLTLGLAFLSDIQVFLFMEAVQGDIRSNVMQAPKLTLFNGQTGNIIVQDFQFFVIGVQVIPQLGQFTYVPQTQLFPLSVTLTIQAVISADRRFVRLSLTPQLTNIVNGEVNLFPVVVPIFPLFDGTATGQPVVFTQFVQQPRLTRVSVQTTVAVPDGGTVLMGGLKRLSEGRNEFGPPILSKIPYLNRLFRNVGYGRSAESLLIMVTPRIIIQAEEEEKQTGYVPPPAVVP